jgi:hypothetical protein
LRRRVQLLQLQAFLGAAGLMPQGAPKFISPANRCRVRQTKAPFAGAGEKP